MNLVTGITYTEGSSKSLIAFLSLSLYRALIKKGPGWHPPPPRATTIGSLSIFNLYVLRQDWIQKWRQIFSKSWELKFKAWRKKLWEKQGFVFSDFQQVFRRKILVYQEKFNNQNKGVFHKKCAFQTLYLGCWPQLRPPSKHSKGR